MTVPGRLLDVIRLGLTVGRASGGAFDIGMGDAVNAWGFGPAEASPDRIRGATQARHAHAYDVLEIDGARVRKRLAITLDLNGVAKGYGVDRLAEIIGGCEAMVETMLTLRPRRCKASTRVRKSPSPEKIT